MGLLNNKVAVVTGGTSGIGEATAKRMASEGAVVFVVGRNEKKGEDVVTEIRRTGGSGFFFKCDVTDRYSIESLENEFWEKYDHLDILFNNAGYMPQSVEIDQMKYEHFCEWEKTFSTNVVGGVLTIRSFLPYLRRSNGCIINNASIAGIHGYVAGKSYAYSASKSAMIQFTQQMALNFGEVGIRVNCICPGIIETNMLGDRDRDLYCKRVPLGYIGDPKDVADAVVFLSSDMARYITGVVLPIDGGASL